MASLRSASTPTAPWLRLALVGLFAALPATSPIAAPIQAAAAEPPTNPTLFVHLSTAPSADATATPPSPASPLDTDAAVALLARLPPAPAIPAGPTSPGLAPSPSALPRAGRLVASPAPTLGRASDAAGGPADAGALRVVRHAPDGDVEAASDVNVSFNQPMITLGPVSDAEHVATLTPAVPGSWRWVGTQTLQFWPTDVLPMATSYSVTVPAGTRSATGGSLDAPVSWSFETPPPEMTSTSPTDDAKAQRPDEIIGVDFDQHVDPVAVLGHVQVLANRVPVEVRLATPAEIASAKSEYGGDGHSIALRSVKPLPLNALIDVEILAGTPSAEGPRTTTADQRFTFHTYGPLTASTAVCPTPGDGTCDPDRRIDVVFTNPVIWNRYRVKGPYSGLDSSLLTISPAVKNLSVAGSDGRDLELYGAFAPNTTYTVTLSRQIRDAFGQSVTGPSPTFRTSARKPPEPGLWSEMRPDEVLDPTGPTTWGVWSQGYSQLEVSAWAVEPQDWDLFLPWRNGVERPESERRGLSPDLPVGHRVWTQTMTLNAVGKSHPVVDLTQAIAAANHGGKTAQLVMVARVPGGPARAQWVQVTHLGVDVQVDATQLLAWVTDLSTGTAVPDAVATLSHVSGRTDVGGLVTLALRDVPGARLVVRSGDDVAMLFPYGGWTKAKPDESLTWSVFSDRGLYRPGETARFKGFVRHVNPAVGGDVELLGKELRTARWALSDGRDEVIAHGVVDVDALGGFDVTVALPGQVSLGGASLSVGPGPETHSADDDRFAASADDPDAADIRIEAFRRPEYEVTVTPQREPYIVGDPGTFEVAAAYYAGGPLTSADTKWSMQYEWDTFAPPGNAGFLFGDGAAWHYGSVRADSSDVEPSLQARTDAAGRATIHADFTANGPPRAIAVTAEAVVSDLSGQGWSAQTSFIVHPASEYVGLRIADPYLDLANSKSGSEIVDAIVTDLDGNRMSGRAIEVRVARKGWNYNDDKWTETEESAGGCTLTSTMDAVPCTLPGLQAGDYVVRARISDPKGRPNETATTFHVYGQPPADAQAGSFLTRRPKPDALDLVPDRETYAPGQTANLLLVSPWFPAEGLLTVQRGGIEHTQRFAMSGPSTSLAVPLVDADTPNAYVNVELIEHPAGARASLPRRLSTSVNLSIPPTHRELAVAVTPEARTLVPGGSTTVAVDVHDALGAVVPDAEVALWVVDESVLALGDYALPDVGWPFYRPRGSNTDSSNNSRDAVRGPPLHPDAGTFNNDFLSRIPTGRSYQSALGSAAGVISGAPMTARADFSALAAFFPSLHTDEHGHVTATVTLPDSVTRYRVMAVAAAGARFFGSGEASLVAQKPLMVRASPPRFLNVGDEADISVVLQNQTGQPLTVDVAGRATNARFVGGGAPGWRVTVGANDRVEVRFPVTTMLPGMATFSFVATPSVAGGATGPAGAAPAEDAVTVELPVQIPTIPEAVAAYSTLDAAPGSRAPVVVQPVARPSDVIPGFGGLDVTTSSTQLAALTDALLYVSTYPYECSEQRASRILAIASLKDELGEFHATGLPAPSALDAQVRTDIARLAAMQTEDGGFGYWPGDRQLDPFLSIHVALALEVAKERGYAVPAGMWKRAISYLDTLLGSGLPNALPDYPDDARRTLIAYSLYVGARMGDANPEGARALIASAGLNGLSTESVAWLLRVLPGDQALRQHLANHAEVTAASAHFVDAYRASPVPVGQVSATHLLLASDHRTDAVVLDALLTDDPQNPLIPQLANGLLDARVAGKWASTQEDGWVLLALDHYFRTMESTSPDFVARAWLDDRLVQRQKFKGRETDRANTVLPLDALPTVPSSAAPTLTIEASGRGRLYTRVGITYAPVTPQGPIDHGFAVTRTLGAVGESPGATSTVHQDSDGTWHIPMGTVVAIWTTMYTPSERANVALVSPLPAGLELLNSSLRGTQLSGPQQELMGAYPSYWLREWFDHTNLRDDRVEAFAQRLWPGAWELVEYARATTRGTFTAAPAHAEEMYSPETSGRSAADKFVVE